MDLPAFYTSATSKPNYFSQVHHCKNSRIFIRISDGFSADYTSFKLKDMYTTALLPRAAFPKQNLRSIC